MLTNGDMTVYHLAEGRSGESQEAGEYWVKTIIRGVCWLSGAAIQAESGIGTSGFRDAGWGEVYIPHSSWSGARPPCRCEDRIARGIRQELTPPQDALAVTSVINMDMGRTVRHWEIAAV